MKSKAVLFALLLFVIAGCASPSGNMIQSQNVPISDSPDAKYQKLYYDYRELVTAAIKSNREASLGQITDEYISKASNPIFLITLSKLDSSGKWKVLLHHSDPNTRIILPQVHYASSKSVHMHKEENYVLCESNETDGTYKDNIYIRMAIKKNIVPLELHNNLQPAD